MNRQSGRRCPEQENHPHLHPSFSMQPRACKGSASGTAGNIYAAMLTLYIAPLAAGSAEGLPAVKPAIQPSAFAHGPAPGLYRLRRTSSHRRTLYSHQKLINWSQIMHESTQSGQFTGLPCVSCIGDILLCLFLFRLNRLYSWSYRDQFSPGPKPPKTGRRD